MLIHTFRKLLRIHFAVAGPAPRVGAVHAVRPILRTRSGRGVGLSSWSRSAASSAEETSDGVAYG